MIDIVIDDSIKPKLISLLDVLPDEEKLKNLHQFFPGEIPQYNKLLENIINRDYNFISVWTKACTLRNMHEIEGDDLVESVVALLFSPEGLMQEESAKLVARSSRELYRSASARISHSVKFRLDKIVGGETNAESLLFEKVKFLSDRFPAIPGEDLLQMATEITYAKNSESGFPSFPDGCIIWSLSDEGTVIKTLIFYADQVKGNDSKIMDIGGNAFYILPLSSVEGFHYQNPEKSFEILKYIDNNEE